MKLKKPKQKGKSVNIALGSLIVCAAVLFSFSIYKIAGIVLEYSKGARAYSTIMSSAVESGGQTEGQDEKNAFQVIDFAKLYSINQDCAGWIQIPDTNINYPMVIGTDNDYYLRRTFEGESYIGGVIFVDYRCARDFSGRNTIIYGHHMNDGTMFANLAKFTDVAYLEKHPQIYIYTPESLRVYEIFAACKTDILNSCYTIEFAGDDTFMRWAGEMQAQSIHDIGVPVSSADEVITLSTCTNVNKADRYIVQAVLVESRALPGA
ncbi:MAG: class B sortase [Oscillospiraceae bacterium]